MSDQANGTMPTKKAKVKQIEEPQKLMDFPDAIREVIAGRRITKVEWESLGAGSHYGHLTGDFLCIHKPNEDDEHHKWTISDGDLLGKDWVVAK